MNDDPLDWLLGLERLGMKFGLENVSRLTQQLGDPHRRFPSVLIAGTNGKGSVTAIVDTALGAAGFRSARYTSPHLMRLEERFVIAGREVETDVLRVAVARVRDAVDTLMARRILDAPATFFECTTAAAFEIFAAARVDTAVLEVGLGGRLDATNIVTPVACAITTIDFDHQAQLGSTLAGIAAEKAGIVKPGVPIVIGRLPPEAEDVVARVAREAGAPLIRASEHPLPPGVRPALAGVHQRDNAEVAAALLCTLRAQGLAIADAAIDRGVTEVRWPGRLERLRYRTAEVLLDAAHNPAGARALAAYLRDENWGDATLVFGAMADKDAHGMLEALMPVIPRIICTTAAGARAAPAASLAAIATSIASGGRVHAVEDPVEALGYAASSSERVVVAGSMFLIGPLRGILR